MPPATSDLAAELAPDLLDRFVRYARIDTQSAPRPHAEPEHAGPARARAHARRGAARGRAPGRRPGRQRLRHRHAAGATATARRSIGLIAHVDTSPDAPGAGVEPIVHRDYDGGRIELPKRRHGARPGRLPELGGRAGHDIVTSSGDTLLGADDKAGVAEIVTAVAHLAAHPELPRPTLRVGFTPDEEIGEGASLFDIERFGAACAYTLDGSTLGELQDETFTRRRGDDHASRASTSIPGFATGKLVNAARLARRSLAALPADR